MAIVAIGEAIFFNEWDTSEYIEYPAIVRSAAKTTVKQAEHREVNLTWFDDNGGQHQASNVKNVEDITLGSTESWWRRQYSNASLKEIGNSYLDTVRVEKGDQVLYRVWNDATGWEEAYFAVVVATLGNPNLDHPRINLRYVNNADSSTLVSNVAPFEGYTSEADAQGNDLWSNIPGVKQFAATVRKSGKKKKKK